MWTDDILYDGGGAPSTGGRKEAISLACGILLTPSRVRDF